MTDLKRLRQRLPDVDYKELKTRTKRRKKQDNDGYAADAAEDLNAKEKFRVFTFCSITDTRTTEMKRSKVYKDVSTRFSFLNNLS